MRNDFINKEIEEMVFLQETINKLTPAMMLSDDREISIEYYHTLYALTDKQHVIYTRLKYSENPQDQEYRMGIEKVTLATGRKQNEPCDVFFTAMKEEIKEVLEQLQGEYMEGEDYPFDPMI